MKRAFFLVVFSLLFSFAAHALPISGKVVGPDGAPMPDVEVEVVSYAPKADPRNITLRTDAVGEFHLDLRPTSYSADFFGRATAYKPGLAVGGVLLHATENVIELEESRMLRGQVQDADGQPVAAARVSLVVVFVQKKPPHDIALFETLLQDKFTATTDAKGFWTLHDLPPSGTANFALNDSRFAPATITAQLEDNKDAPPLIARPGAVVRGLVVDENQKPVAGAVVFIGGSTQSLLGNLVTDEKGIFQTGGMAAGAVHGYLRGPNQESVAAMPKNIVAREGQTTEIGTITLGTGALVEGRATDATTGKGLANVSFSDSEYGISELTDEGGRALLRVPLGRDKFVTNSTPSGYGYPDANVVELDLKAGETKSVAFSLPRQLSIAGVAIDENGKPVEGARLSFGRAEDGSDLNAPTAETKADGAWEKKYLKSGAVKITTRGAWEMAAPLIVFLPHDEPVHVILRPSTSPKLVGRVVTPQGEAIENAEIKADIWVPDAHDEQESNVDNRPPFHSDAAGRFEIAGLRADSSITLSVKKDNYRFVSGGLVSRQDAKFVVSDFVLVPLDSRVSGQVVDEIKMPVAGATIFSPDGSADNGTQTNADGRFTLGKLPSGAVLLLAVKDGKIGTARGEKEVAITLATPQPPKANDLWRAYAVIQEAWTDSRDSGYDFRETLPTVLAPYDPDLVLQIATDPYGHISGWTIANSIDALARHDPVKTLLWSPPRLKLIEDDWMRFTATLFVAKYTAEVDPDLSKKLWKEARDLWSNRLKGRGDDWTQMRDLVSLALVAAATKVEDAHPWFDRAIETGAKSNAAYWAIAQMAPIFPQEAEKLAPQLEDGRRTMKGWALSGVTKALAPVDVAAARRLLAVLWERVGEDDQARQSINKASRAVVRELAKTEPEAALALARQWTNANKSPDPETLALAATHLPDAKRAAIFQEAFNQTEGAYSAPATQARVAALAYETDPALGRRLFHQFGLLIQNERNRGTNWDNSSGIAEFAFYLSRDDPATARLLLEQEYSRRLDAPGMNNNSVSGSIALAMIALDADRALEIARTFPITKSRRSEARFETFKKIARYLLMSADERRKLDFNTWQAEWDTG